KHGKVRDYYKKQERLLEGFNEMETINEFGYLHDMLLNKAHNIGEMLQEKLEQLSEVEKAFVHIDFEFSHRREHKAKV
nr:metal tolerance protein 9-like [Tanacetum cinerariifolium]